MRVPLHRGWPSACLPDLRKTIRELAKDDTISHFKIGRTNVLTNAMATAATMAATKLVTMNPATILLVIQMAAAVASQVNKKCFMVLKRNREREIPIHN